MIDTDDYILEHFGVKGMKWGVRNAREGASASEKAKVERRRSNVKKASIILGSAAVAGALVVGGVYAKKHFNVKLSDISKPKASVKKVAESLAKEPTAIISSSRGKSKGYMFLHRGGLDDPLSEFAKSGLETSGPGFFRRYGERGEKVATTFLDPLGRKDQAGRVIPHSVIFPEGMSKGINNAEDAQKAAWPMIKDLVGALYQTKYEDALGPAF